MGEDRESAAPLFLAFSPLSTNWLKTHYVLPRCNRVLCTFAHQASRITETNWTKLYIGFACFQVIVIIILQSFIAVENTQEILPLTDAPLTDQYNSTNQGLAEDRFTRIKWENIAFIGFQAWFLGMAFDAVCLNESGQGKGGVGQYQRPG